MKYLKTLFDKKYDYRYTPTEVARNIRFTKAFGKSFSQNLSLSRFDKRSIQKIWNKIIDSRKH